MIDDQFDVQLRYRYLKIHQNHHFSILLPVLFWSNFSYIFVSRDSLGPQLTSYLEEFFILENLAWMVLFKYSKTHKTKLITLFISSKDLVALSNTPKWPYINIKITFEKNHFLTILTDFLTSMPRQLRRRIFPKFL